MFINAKLLDRVLNYDAQICRHNVPNPWSREYKCRRL